MDKTDVIRMYALQLARQPYYTAGQARIYLKKDGYCYATDPAADFRQFEYACISDITGEADVLKDVLMASRDMGALVAARTPYASICAASERDICASLDDMAQFVGRRIVAVPGAFRSIQKALHRTCAVMVSAGDPYVVAGGRTLYEACMALTVLEKSAEVNLKAAVLGGRKPLGAGDCRMLRRKYRKGRSVQQEGESVSEGLWDSVSERLDEEYMLCSPSGADCRALEPSDMVKVKIRDLRYEGDRRPTSECALHAAIYTSRPDVGAVIHTHSKNCCVFAAAEMPLQVEEPAHREALGDLIRVTRYALPGSRKLAKRTLASLKDAPGAIMAHHGMTCCGADLAEAQRNCQLIEEAAEKAIDRRLE